jgi:hypothetical protein
VGCQWCWNSIGDMPSPGSQCMASPKRHAPVPTIAAVLRRVGCPGRRQFQPLPVRRRAQTSALRYGVDKQRRCATSATLVPGRRDV